MNQTLQLNTSLPSLWTFRLPCEASLSRRGMTAKEAAQFYGLAVSTFQKARREGKIPGPTLPGKRYDRVLLEKEMNKLSGIVENNLTPLDHWRKHHGSRQH